MKTYLLIILYIAGVCLPAYNQDIKFSDGNVGQLENYADSAALREVYLEQRIQAAKTAKPGNFSLQPVNQSQKGNGLQSDNMAMAAAASLPSIYDFYVATNGNDNNSGTQSAPLRTIQKAITKSVSGKTIKVANGWYAECIDFMGKSIKLVGNPDDPASVVISGCSGSGSQRIVVKMTNGEDTNTLLCGFTISAGGSSNNGYGPSVYIANYASPLLSHLTFYHCHAATDGILTIFNYSKPVLQNTVILNNSSEPGNYMLHIDYGSEATFRNITMADNYDVKAAIGVTGGSKLNMVNSIIYNPNLTREVEVSGSNASVSHCNIRGGATMLDGAITLGSGIINVNPGFELYTNLLASTSPCVDAGDPSPMWNDVKFPPSKGTVRNDMGAYGGPMNMEYSMIRPGDNRDHPIHVGLVLVDFDNFGIQFKDSQNTNNFTNAYTGRPTNDVFYKFSITQKTDVEIKLCGSSIDTYLWLLDANGNGVMQDVDGNTVEPYNDNYTGTGQCENTTHSYMSRRLAPGTYYVVVEGNSQNGNITTSISGKQILPGDTRQEAINFGTFSGSFQRNDTRNTDLYTNKYGLATNDVFHKFTITKKMNITLSHCGINLDTYLYLLDAAGNCIAENDNNAGVDACWFTSSAYLRRNGLAPGTYYVVSEGVKSNHSLMLSIEGTEIVASELYGYPDAPSIGSSETAPVGSINGAFNVSATGAATYTIPIEAPPGVGGMQPSVAITYNSQTGNGVVGWGCNIAGIQAITRTPKSTYYDVTAKGLTYHADEGYVLNGQRLIYDGPVGKEGKEGGIYYPETDPHTKVLAHGNYTTQACNTWFEVQTKDGMKYFYGSASGKLAYSAIYSFTEYIIIPKIYSWNLDYAEDLMGNYMTYTYSYNQKDYCPYLATITYGKNKNIAASLENTITFTYEARPDSINFKLEYLNGMMSKRLAGIVCKTGNTTYREYALGYANFDHFSRLTSVTEKNGAGESLKPTTIQWNYLPAFAQECTYTNNLANVTVLGTNIPYADQTFTSADMNNDGLDDLIGLFPAKYNNYDRIYAYVYWASLNQAGKPQFSSGELINMGAGNMNYPDFKMIRGGCTPIDFNGDGHKEILNTGFYSNNGYNSVKFQFFRPGDDQYGSFEYTLQRSTEMPLYATGDMDNDGVGEVIILEKGSIKKMYLGAIAKLNPDGQAVSYQTFEVFLDNKPEKLFVADFDGDGTNDKVIFYKGGYMIEAGSGTKWYTGKDIGNCWMMRMGDFNGDGLPDFIMNATNDCNWYFAMNNGNGFSKQLAGAPYIFDNDFTDEDDDKFDCQVYDFDHDGKSDVVIQKAMYDPILGFSKTYTYWMRSTGSALEVITSTSSDNEYDALSKVFVSGDFDGDGKVELMNFGYNCYDGSNTSRSWRMYKNPNLAAGSGMVSSITDGFGNKTDVTYATLPGSNIYTKRSDSEFPLIDLTPPLPAVKSVVTDNGVSNAVTMNYAYTGARIHMQGKGFMGMTSVKATNSIMGITTESGISALNPVYFAPATTYTLTTVGGQTAESTVEYAFVDKTKKKYFAYPAVRTTKDLDEDTQTAFSKYDDNGNITHDSVFYDTGMYRATRYGNYIATGGGTKPRVITTVQKHKDDGNVFTRKTEITYDTSKGYITQKIENSRSSKPLTTTYSYDGYGNLLNTTVSGSGAPSLATHTVYDASGRFPVKQYNNPSSTVAVFKYDTWGNVTKEKDATNPADTLTTSHSYDGWGRRTSTTLPDGRIIGYSTGWGTTTAKRYYTLTQASGAPWVKTWYDATGRETAAETRGADDMVIATEKKFNYKGELARLETKTGAQGAWETYTYDARGRVLTLENNRYQYQKVTNVYGKRMVTTTVFDPFGNKVTTKTFDQWGGLKTVTDAGGSVNYTYKSTGSPGNIAGAGANFGMTYDEAGNQLTLNDPNAGLIQYRYDALGRVIWQKDAKNHVTTTKYDVSGRVDSTTLNGVKTEYAYGTTGNNLHRLTQVKKGTSRVRYAYDRHGRVLTETRTIEGADSVTFIYTYHANGQVKTTTYPGGVTVENAYDPYSNLVKVTATGQTVWEQTAATGTVDIAKLGGGTMTATAGYNDDGFLTRLKTVKGSATIRDFAYDYRMSSGNLALRTGMIAQQETFDYDKLDRLTKVYHGGSGTPAMKIDYHANGNISFKTDLGNFSYNETIRPHALAGIENTGRLISTGQSVTWNAFNKATNLKDTLANDAYELDIIYGPDQQRWKTMLKRNGTVTKTVIFAGDYERVTKSDTITHLYYMPGGGIYVKQAKGSVTLKNGMYYVHPDHLGSLAVVTDAAGNMVQKCTFDAWGKRSFVTKDRSLIFDRGYTGHEHLDEFSLINMNGRMYDPLVGRFLSPDPFVQMPDFSQSFNRYSYCINNPLKYTDPSGENPLLIAFLAGAYLGMQQTAMSSDKTGFGLIGDAAKGFVIGGVAGIAGAWAGTAVANAVNFSGFAGGFASGFSGGLASGSVYGVGNSILNDSKFNLTSVGTTALSSGIINGVISLCSAVANGASWWNGIAYDEQIVGDGIVSTKEINRAILYNKSAAADINDKLLKAYVELDFNFTENTFNTNSISTKPNTDRFGMTRNQLYINKKDGNLIAGYVQRVDGKPKFTDFRIAPYYVVNYNPVDFQAVAGHEVTHSFHYFMFKRNFDFISSERVAYKWTYDVYMNAGQYNKAFDTMMTALKLGYWGAYNPSYKLPGLLYNIF